jgi:hypothetical protein
MGKNIRTSRIEVGGFLRFANPQDDFFLVEFDSKPRLMMPLTSAAHAAEISNRLIFVKSEGFTALLDAIDLSLHEMKKSKEAQEGFTDSVGRGRQSQPLHPG